MRKESGTSSGHAGSDTRGKGMDEFPRMIIKHAWQEPNTCFEASALNITMSRTLLCCKYFC
uniref:Uncharacterized protein n=1 Tax=Helianthus annuus TaxID=4232 RepID=A0A251U2H2_HELAN